MRGHEEASGTKYVPKDLMSTWALKDPVDNYERFLEDSGVLDTETKEKLNKKIKDAINKGLEKAFAEESPFNPILQRNWQICSLLSNKKSFYLHQTRSEKRFIDAISDGLRQSMEKYPQPHPDGTGHWDLWWGI
jgi:2-oxoisovalerate dehydrogenase E1 component